MANVLIFGATSAIATEVAALLAQRGDRLVLVGRNETKLARLEARLGEAVVRTIQADLDQTERAADLVEQSINALGGGLDIAVIAHGLLGDQPQTEAAFPAAAASLQTNLISPIALLIALANHMQAQHSGRIAVLSSVAGERGRPRNYTYGAAKGGLTLYLQGLRSRLWATGVAVDTIKLGPVDTPMTVDHPKNALFATAESAAQGIVGALRGPGGEVYVPAVWQPIMLVVRWLPEPVFQRLGFLSGR